MTRGEALRKFRRHWREISRVKMYGSPQQIKAMCLSESDLFMTNLCYLCEYAKSAPKEQRRPEEQRMPGELALSSAMCSACPIDWRPSNCCCGGGAGLYSTWRFTHDPEKRQAIALAISRLPRKKRR